MNLPAQSSIQPVSYGPNTANTLRVISLQGPGIPQFPYQILSVSGDVETLFSQGTCPMTEEQWAKWDDAEPDNDYILACVAENLGLELA